MKQKQERKREIPNASLSKDHMRILIAPGAAPLQFLTSATLSLRTSKLFSKKMAMQNSPYRLPGVTSPLPRPFLLARSLTKLWPDSSFGFFTTDCPCSSTRVSTSSPVTTTSRCSGWSEWVGCGWGRSEGAVEMRRQRSKGYIHTYIRTKYVLRDQKGNT